MQAQHFLLLSILFSFCFIAQGTPDRRLDFALNRPDYEQLFAEWMEFYGKTYSCPEEQQLRLYNFIDSIHRARALNEKAGNPKLYGITKFSDLSKAEFKAKYLMSNNLLDQLKTMPTPSTNITVEKLVKMTNPRGVTLFKTKEGKEIRFDPNNMPTMNPNTLYDWGNEGYTTPVKNQGQCGSCWAHSATEQIESNWAMVHGLPPPLSVQQIVDCDTTSSGCNGGYTYSAYDYVYGVGGLETDAEYPYVGVQQACNDGGQKVADLSSYQVIGQNDEATMFQFMSSGGPLSICLNADNLETYQGNNQILPGSTCNPGDVDHCVQLTGWLTDGNGNIEAWHLRNSWGTDWGMAGYALIQYGVNACNLACYPTTTTSA